MKLITLFLFVLLSSIFQGCVVKTQDMGEFGIDNFAQVPKICTIDSQCKILTVGYKDCANYRYMVYSSKTIYGSNESALISQTQDYTNREKQTFNGERCVFMSSAPAKGTCYKKACEMVKTWR